MIIFQIRQKQRLIFNYLKKNKIFSKNLLKKCAFKRLIFACKYSQEQIMIKNNLFNNNFCNLLYSKCGIILLKHFVLNKKITQEENKINVGKQKIINYKKNFPFFKTIIIKKLKINKILHKYNIYKIHQIHILFFKNIAINMQKRALCKQKKEQANNFYASNLVKKSIKLWKLNYKIKKDKNNKLLRRKIIGKIFINNLKNHLDEQRLIGMKYRCILLKKYYFYRLQRTVHYLINNKIAKLKFISKFIFLWKEIAKKIRVNKYNGLNILVEIFPHLQLSYFFKMKKIFMLKFKQKNICLIQNEIISTKIANFQNKTQYILKRKIFLEIKYNYIIRKISKKKNISQKRKIFSLIKANKNKGMSKELKQFEADKLYIKHMKNLIKKCINNWHFLSNETTIKINEMKNHIYKKNIFEFLKKFGYKNKKIELKLSTKFRTYFLYYYFFEMMKKYNKIIKRENMIIKGVQRLINENELDYKYWAFKSLYNNFLVENFIKQKNLRLKTKIFYSLKMVCG